MRYRRTRTTQDQQLRHARKNGFTILRPKAAKSVTFAWKGDPATGSVDLKCWRGKRARPSFYYRYPTAEKAEAKCASVIASAKADQERKAKRRAERNAVKASDHWSVGDVGTYTWGYEQTNVDYFEVVEVLAKSIRIREIACKSRETAYLQGVSQPDRGNYVGEPILKRVQAAGYVSMDFGSLSKWNGKASQWTAYH